MSSALALEATGVDRLGEWDPARVRGLSGLLAALNETGEITAADVHIARGLTRLTGEERETHALAVALTVRAVRGGSVCLDLGGVPVGPDDERTQLWPAVPPEDWPRVHEDGWVAELAGSALIGGSGGAGVHPLRLDGDRLYLDRYWQEETAVLTHLETRGARSVPVDEAALAASLAEYFPGEGFADQRAAAEVAARSLTSVITGGPGTGKTTTVARLLGSLLDQDPYARIALAAPTGKAAARMAEAIRAAAADPTFPTRHADRIAALPATTIHRLLGTIPDQGTRFRHHRGNRLPVDMVVLDETSMVSLTMMARILEALRPGARLVLVGDADQLASVEAGAVLGDLVAGLRSRPGAPVAELTRNRRFGEGIGALAGAVRDGDSDAALAALTSGNPSRRFIGIDDLEGIVTPAALRLHELAAAGDRAGALTVLEEHRMLCAHRDGPTGAAHWNRRLEEWLAASLGHRLGRWYPGQPLLVTSNDYGLRLYNGDIGVVVDTGAGGLAAVIADGSHPQGRLVALARLNDVVTAHAMTVHRSQGSQFQDVSVLLPAIDSAILTRELLYTALTRARRSVAIVGEQEVLVRAITHHTSRASGLAQRLARSAGSVARGHELVDHAARQPPTLRDGDAV
ncbi:exodeoxyribonuclease V subunit alpha [Pseudactinotalea sp. HY160]|uniref:exodeoxyribonuclease V subunit alpha n=1 Tax=Pseudactinotalea sp. HY160 TaxID=2654490 RepID=UPI00128E133D|nr:exodeoxyribonuclease V subunit alpha [Pseudactinotalea sp. HY160]MPV49004.1 exodeoxyribonuclease V subunit alpha [Pseudactinotalea sp. HY160]